MDCTTLQHDLDKIYKWTKTSQLPLNDQKCEYMHIRRRKLAGNAFPEYHIDGSTVKQTDVLKYLGVSITPDLDFTTHITNTTGKASKVLGLLKRTMPRATASAKSLAYKTVCRPTLEYASVVWSPHRKGNTRNLEAVQRKAFRWSHRLKRTDRISSHMLAEG